MFISNNRCKKKIKSYEKGDVYFYEKEKII